MSTWRSCREKGSIFGAMAKFLKQMDNNRLKINFDVFRYDNFVVSKWRQKILASKLNGPQSMVLEFLLFTTDRENQPEV